MKYELYDFNGTIYNGNLTKDILFLVLRKYPQFLFITIWAKFLYIFKMIDQKKYKNKLYSFTKKMDNMNAFVDCFWSKKENKLNEFWTKKKSHKNDIIISNECEFILEYIMKKYNVGKIIGAKYNLETSEFIDDNFNIENKIEEFYELNNKPKINLYLNNNSFINISNINEIYYIKKGKVISKKNYKHSIIKIIVYKVKSIINNREIFCYLVAGVLTVLVNLLVKWLLLITIFNEEKVFELQITVILSWIIAVIFAYFINRIYVFRSNNSKKIYEFIKFLSSRVLTLLIEMLLTWILITLCKLNVTVMIIVIQFIIIILNYFFSKIFIFKK